MSDNFVTAQQVYAVLKPYALTREQQDAVEKAPADSPALVVAGAGSGKTELMSVRVLWLVANGLAQPHQILGLTFTRKAASELSNRIFQALLKLRDSHLWPANVPYDFAQPSIMTYNSYANTLFRENALGLGLEAEATLLTEAASYQLAREVIIKYGTQVDARLADVDLKLNSLVELVLEMAGSMNDNQADATAVARVTGEVLERFSGLPKKSGSSDYSQFSYYSGILEPFQSTQVIAALAQRYREEKHRLGYVDYSDQVALAAKAVAEIPDVAVGQRAKYLNVLLDEYQDTSVLQTRLLANLFHGVGVLAVGDPNQSIYGWRGASSSNLATFASDFAARDKNGSEQHVQSFELSTSWRNPKKVLDLANHLATDLKTPPPYLRSSESHLVPLSLHSRQDAIDGRIQVKIDQTVEDEARSVAKWFKAQFQLAQGSQEVPKAAVLTRTRKFMQLFREAIENEGIPVQVVGLGGLLELSEIVDLTSALRVIHDPNSGAELIRLLAGARWRIGPKDIDRLFRFAKRQNRFHLTEDSFAPEDSISIVDALDLLLDPETAKTAGFGDLALARLQNAAQLFANLRKQTGLPLVDFVRLVENELWLDIEVMANPAKKHPMAHLNAFANIVANYAASTQRPHLGAFLRWLEYAEERERHEVASTAPEAGVVQLLTIHAAKGLEWDLVAISNLTEGDFPSTGRSTSGWLGNGQLPYPLRGDVDSLPEWDTRNVTSQAELKKSKDAFVDDMRQHLMREELRLMYVAVTRPKRSLLLTAAYWQPGIKKPKTLSQFLVAASLLPGEDVELYDRRDPVAVAEELGIDVSPVLAFPSCLHSENPMEANESTQEWPLAPLGPNHSVAMAEAAAAVGHAIGTPPNSSPVDQIELLLREREQRAISGRDVSLPVRVNASAFKDYLTDTRNLAQRMLRPVPAQPFLATREGTLFHQLMERRNSGLTRGLSQNPELDLADASERFWEETQDTTEMVEHGQSIEELSANFERSEWGNRVAEFAEIEIQFALDDNIFVCKLDAVYRMPDGGYQIVDWKTGKAPTEQTEVERRGLQLSLYRLAFANLMNIPPKSVQACFYYVAENRVIYPSKLLSLAELKEAWSRLTD